MWLAGCGDYEYSDSFKGKCGKKRVRGLTCVWGGGGGK